MPHFIQFDQSDLMLSSTEYYQLGPNNTIMQTYYKILVKVATMLGAEPTRAQRDMKNLLDFEIELAKVSYHFTLC